MRNKNPHSFRFSPEAEAAGVEWSADVLRHTYASMRMGAGGNAAEVAGEMGNSPGILLTHYRELVTADDAAKFWAILPNLPVVHKGPVRPPGARP